MGDLDTDSASASPYSISVDVPYSISVDVPYSISVGSVGVDHAAGDHRQQRPQPAYGIGLVS